MSVSGSEVKEREGRNDSSENECRRFEDEETWGRREVIVGSQQRSISQIKLANCAPSGEGGQRAANECDGTKRARIGSEPFTTLP